MRLAPSLWAMASRSLSTSRPLTPTHSAPAAIAATTHASPRGPGPSTMTVSPGFKICQLDRPGVAGGERMDEGRQLGGDVVGNHVQSSRWIEIEVFG